LAYEGWDHDGLIPAKTRCARGRAGVFWCSACRVVRRSSGVEDFLFNAVHQREAAPVGAFRVRAVHHDCRTTSPCRTPQPSFCDEQHRSRWLPGSSAGALILGSRFQSLEPVRSPGQPDPASATGLALHPQNGSRTFITTGLNAELVITAVPDGSTQASGHQPLGLRCDTTALRHARAQPREARPPRDTARAVLLRRRVSPAAT